MVKSFSYDLAGRTTGITDAGGTTSLAYDYEHRVTSISRPGMTTNTFAYNGLDSSGAWRQARPSNLDPAAGRQPATLAKASAAL